MSSSIFWKLFSAYLMIFYTDVLVYQLPQWELCFHHPYLGLHFGWYNGNYCRPDTDRWGKFRPYLLWAAIPFAVIGAYYFYKHPI